MKTKIAPPILYSEASEQKHSRSDYSKAGTEIDPGHDNNLQEGVQTATTDSRPEVQRQAQESHADSASKPVNDMDLLLSMQMASARKASRFQNVVIKANNAMHRLDEDDNVVIDQNGPRTLPENFVRSRGTGTGFGANMQGYIPKGQATTNGQQRLNLDGNSPNS